MWRETTRGWACKGAFPLLSILLLTESTARGPLLDSTWWGWPLPPSRVFVEHLPTTLTCFEQEHLPIYPQHHTTTLPLKPTPRPPLPHLKHEAEGSASFMIRHWGRQEWEGARYAHKKSPPIFTDKQLVPTEIQSNGASSPCPLPTPTFPNTTTTPPSLEVWDGGVCLPNTTLPLTFQARGLLKAFLPPTTTPCSKHETEGQHPPLPLVLRVRDKGVSRYCPSLAQKPPASGCVLGIQRLSFPPATWTPRHAHSGVFLVFGGPICLAFRAALKRKMD